MNKKTVLLLGATGLVGGECLTLFLEKDQYKKIVILTRSPLRSVIHDERIDQHIIDFESLNEYRHLMKADHVVSSLGTTIKKAGSKQNFLKVDFKYTYEIAKLAAQEGAEHFFLVSALGADPESSIFYNRVKGEVERAVQNLPYRSINIFRPSLILGDRPERRLTEEISKILAGILSFAIPARYKPVQASNIAKAIMQIAATNPAGVRIIESEEITVISKEAGSR
jgi:uncharacterized protein YbjT (DUF2867 family)